MILPRPTKLLWLLTAAVALSATALSAGEPLPALVIAEGSVARSQVVAIGRDLSVAGVARSDVAAINGSVRLVGRVEGDVIVMGGDAVLEDGAVVEGDVFVLGGRLESHQGARIDGRAVSYPSVSSAWLTLLEGPSLGLSAVSPVVLGAKLALLATWLALALLLFATSGHGVLSTSDAVTLEPLRCFIVGLTGVVTLALTALFFSAFASSVIGLPLLVLVVLMALLLKLWGMVAVFHALGRWVARVVFRRLLLPLNSAVLGLLLLGGLKFIPWIGTWVWTAATLIGVGASLTTKFGRREPWFEVSPGVPIGGVS